MFAFLQVDVGSLDVASAAKLLLDAVVNKNWWVVAGLGVWLAVTLLRKYGTSIPFLGKFLLLKWSGPLLAALFSAAGALLAALFSGEGFTLKLAFAVLGAAASAVFTQEVQQKAREAASGEAAKLKTAADADAFFKKE